MATHALRSYLWILVHDGSLVKHNGSLEVELLSYGAGMIYQDVGGQHSYVAHLVGGSNRAFAWSWLFWIYFKKLFW